jgi:Mg2+-importing ATPase
VTIPGDNVDDAYLRRPQQWDMRVIRDFMVFIGPVSSIFDFLTFCALLHYFHARESLFHTGWFVESLATQTLVFTRLPASYFAFLIPATLTYLVMVDVAKRQLVRRLGL